MLVRSRKGADAGNAAGMYDLAVMYMKGRAVARDEAQAAVWYRKAAEAGDTDAMRSIANLYSDGRQRQVQQLQEQFQRASAAIGDEAKTRMMRELDHKQKELKRDTEDCDDGIQARQSKIKQETGARMIEVVGKFATENQPTLVMDRNAGQTQVAYAAAPIDITRDIVFHARRALGIGAADKRDITQAENTRLRAALDQCAGPNGFTLVLDTGGTDSTVFYAPEGAWITAAVRAELR